MAVANIISAFGLAGSAGLNAYIPLLIVAILGRMGVINLTQPYDIITSWWAIGALVILGAIEFVVDKVPGADHVNDIVQTFIRPTAGAVLFAANSGVIGEASPTLALIAGLVMATGVHATKAVARPVVTTTTMGIGTPVISFLEDVTSTIASLLAIFLPAIFLLFVVFVGYVFYRLWRRARRAKRQESLETYESDAYKNA